MKGGRKIRENSAATLWQQRRPVEVDESDVSVGMAAAKIGGQSASTSLAVASSRTIACTGLHAHCRFLSSLRASLHSAAPPLLPR
jgi:hypothetical protein